MPLYFEPSDFTPNCEWCGGRGCIHCPSRQTPEQIVDKLASGKYPILGIRKQQDMWVAMYPDPELYDAEQAKKQPAEAPACTDHEWQFEPGKHHLRRCRRPGCDVQQRLEITATHPQGHWVRVFPVLPGLQDLFNRPNPKETNAPKTTKGKKLSGSSTEV